MSIKRVTDWRGWLEGFYDSWMDALTSSLLAFGGSNALGSSIPALKNVGLNWEQAGGIFASITFWSMVRYLQAHKRPQVVEETVDTTFISKNPTTGETVTQSSSTKTTTPIAPISDNAPTNSGNP